MLKQKSAIVTGSTSGIGLGIARGLAEQGADILLNGFGNADEIEFTRAELQRQYGVKVRYSNADIDDVTRLVELHLRFHGYGDGTWTDSAVRRYVVDAGPQLARLHKLTRSDCTTRNRRKAERLTAAYLDLEERIARLREREELDAIRPDLDGNQIMEILGIPPGPLVGRAYTHLRQLRLDRGPIGFDAAREELLRWWAAQASPNDKDDNPDDKDDNL